MFEWVLNTPLLTFRSAFWLIRAGYVQGFVQLLICMTRFVTFKTFLERKLKTVFSCFQFSKLFIQSRWITNNFLLSYEAIKYLRRQITIVLFVCFVIVFVEVHFILCIITIITARRS